MVGVFFAIKAGRVFEDPDVQFAVHLSKVTKATAHGEKHN